MALRASRRLMLGQYGRILDLGGMPHASTSVSNIRSKDGSKNSKVQAIAFDFHLLTRSVGKPKDQAETASPPKIIEKAKEPVIPDVEKVHGIANLLNVDLGGDSGKKHPKHQEDDLSALLMGESASSASDSPTGSLHKQQEKDSVSSKSTSSFLSNDVRSKYADKLRNKFATGGSLAGMDRAKHDREEALKKGDAAGHLAARAMASTQFAASSSSKNKKWLATTGTGSLLAYVTNRSIKVALLPIPGNNEHQEEEGERMDDFCQQLSNHVTFDVLVKKGKAVKEILDKVQKEVNVEPVATMVVSDRDDYLKAAKERGMISCRIRPLNARRGNITANYNVQTVADIQDVVNEINGISFNAVFAAGKS